MMLLSYTIIDFHLFYDGAVDIQIWAPLTRSQCKFEFSETQVTVKAYGPLVKYLIFYKKVCIEACGKTFLHIKPDGRTNPTVKR